MEHTNQAENDELDALIDEGFERYQYQSDDDKPRIIELLQAEKELANARVMLAAWEIFRNGISEQYPELLKWCPQNTITIHDPELPGVVIFDSVNP